MTQRVVKVVRSYLADHDCEWLHLVRVKGFWVVLSKYKGDRDIGAVVPDLPGCFSQGESVKQALRNIKEAMELYLTPSINSIITSSEVNLP